MQRSKHVRLGSQKRCSAPTFISEVLPVAAETKELTAQCLRIVLPFGISYNATDSDVKTSSTATPP